MTLILHSAAQIIHSHILCKIQLNLVTVVKTVVLNSASKGEFVLALVFSTCFFSYTLRLQLKRCLDTVAVVLHKSSLKIEAGFLLYEQENDLIYSPIFSGRAAADWVGTESTSVLTYIQYISSIYPVYCMSSGSFIPLSINKWLLLLHPAALYCQLLRTRLNYNCYALPGKSAHFINIISPLVPTCRLIPEACLHHGSGSQPFVMSEPDQKHGGK